MVAYLVDVILRALHKSISGLGWGMNIILAFLLLLFYLIIGLPTLDAKIALAVVIFAFVLTYIVYVIWELQAVFPNKLIVKKRNTMHGAELVIWNNEVVDLMELDVQLVKKIWVTDAGGAVRIPVNPDNRSFELVGEQKVSYGGGSKVVLLASGKEENATFNMKTPELDIGHEHHDMIDRSKYDIVVQVKGKINGRPIYPKKIKGMLKYMRAPQEVRLQGSGAVRLVKSVYSRMEWDNLNEE